MATIDGSEVASSFLDKNNPYYLLRLFSLLSVVSVVVIVLLVGYGVHRIYSMQMVSDAEENAIAVGEAIFDQERKVLLAQEPGGRQRVVLALDDFAGFDERMRKYLRPFDIYKIKVFSSNKLIVYSTDHSIIGKVDSDNSKLDRVLRSGDVVSKLEKKGEVWDLGGEQRYDVDAVETYIPLRVDDAIVGSFEVYVDVSRTRQRIAKVLALSVAVLFSVLVVVFLVLYVPMRQETAWLKEAQDKLRETAATDVLTGMFNRRYLFTRIEEEYARMERNRRGQTMQPSLGFIMIDIDHFKAINDTYGHLAGDEIIRELATRLTRSLRVYDVIGRYGGEEFLAVLPHTDFDEVKRVAERMHEVVRATPFKVNGASIKVTVSAGVAHSVNAGEDMLAAIGRADAGLYKAKHSGRDHVAWV